MEETEVQQQNTQQQSQENDTLTTNLCGRRVEWTQKIESLNSQLKNLPKIDNLLNTIYTERQRAVHDHEETVRTYKSQMIIYKQKYADLYNSIKMGKNGIRYSSESSIGYQCEANMGDIQDIVNELKTHADFMAQTIESLDGICYAIKTKVEIYKILNGIKF